MSALLKKPRKWNISSGFVAPEWLRFWSHLTTLRLFLDKSTSLLPDIITGFSPVTQGTPIIGHGKSGHFFGFDATNENISIGNTTNGAMFPRVTHGTIAFVRRKVDSTNRAHSTCGIANATDRINIHNPFSDGVTYFDWGGSAGDRRISATVSVSQEIENWVFVAGPQGMAFYQNGILRASNSAAATNAATTESFFINKASSSAGDLVEFYLFATFDDAWTAKQVSKWSRDPFDPFRMAEGVGDVITPSGIVVSTDSLIPILKRRRR